MLAELLRENVLRSSAECTREWIVVGRKHVYDWDIQVLFVKFELVSGDCCSTLREYDRAANKVKILQIGDCKMLKQRVYARHELGAEREKLDSFVSVRDEGDKEEEI